MCPCCFVISVFYSVLLNVGKGRLAKDGSLAPHTHKKLSEITRGVTYTMVCGRLDISHVVSMVSRYMHNLRKRHWQSIKWILKYILGTIDVGIIFQQGSST